jgi:hypothetical protein
MGRKHSPKGQVVLRKDEKMKSVVAALPAGSTPDSYATKFQEMYPEDWGKIVRRYKRHERQTPRGKAHPMPEPNQYLLNMVNNFLTKKRVVESTK